MYPSRMLYETTRTQQAEDRARAEAWRRRQPPARRHRAGRIALEQATSAPRRLARQAVGLANLGRRRAAGSG